MPRKGLHAQRYYGWYNQPLLGRHYDIPNIYFLPDAARQWGIRTASQYTIPWKRTWRTRARIKYASKARKLDIAKRHMAAYRIKRFMMRGY